MSEENEPKIEVFQSRLFEKVFTRLTDEQKDLVDDEIDRIEENPTLGKQKKGDLSHVWVHKFKMENGQVLLGYSWNEGKLELYLLNLGPHENFYSDAKKRRKADLKLIS